MTDRVVDLRSGSVAGRFPGVIDPAHVQNNIVIADVGQAGWAAADFVSIPQAARNLQVAWNLQVARNLQVAQRS